MLVMKESNRRCAVLKCQMLELVVGRLGKLAVVGVRFRVMDTVDGQKNWCGGF